MRPWEKNKNLLAGITISLIVLGGIILMANPKFSGVKEDSQGGADSFLEAAEREFDFGTISMADGKVEHTFTIRNATADAVMIEKLYTSCMCTEAVLISGLDRFGPYGMEGHGFIPRIGKKLRDGDEAKIVAIYDPEAHGPAGIGPVNRTVTVETDSGKLEFRIKAVVTP